MHAQALPTAPESMATDVETACTGACGLESCVADHLEAMRTRLQQYLQGQGLLFPLVYEGVRPRGEPGVLRQGGRREGEDGD